MEALRGWILDASLEDWIWRLVHVSAVGQTLFVVLWASLPWWRTLVGRALMVKSLALMIYLDWVVVIEHLGMFEGRRVISVVLFGLVAFGIWSQVAAIAHEMLRAPRDEVRTGA